MTFTEFLRPKRRLYRAIFFAVAISGLLATIVLHWVFLQTPERGFVQAHFGIPWWAATWLAWVVWVMIVPTAMLCFEALLYYSRLDRKDHAWSSMAWTLRSWPAAIVYSVVANAVILLTLGLLHGMTESGVGDSLVPVLANLPFALSCAVIGLVAWNAANLKGESPPTLRNWRVRWPGWWPPLLQSAMVVAPSLLPVPFWDSASDAVRWVGVGTLLLLAIFLCLVVQLAWLNASELSLRQTIGTAFRPRIFMAMCALGIRWLALACCLILPVLPIWFLLVMGVPGFAPVLEDSDYVRLHWFIEASEWAVAYWWLTAAVAFMPIAASWQWLASVSSGRLLVELGVTKALAEAKEALH